MSLRIGNNEPSKLYVGTSPVEKIYHGSQQVWSNVPPPPFVGGLWAGRPEDQTLTVTVEEVTPSGDLFSPLPVEWRIRVTGTSTTNPNYNPEPVSAPYDVITSAQEDEIRLGWEAHDPSYQRCQFVVHTGDTGNYRNTWVGSAAHRDKAFQYGQNCGHVYSEPGTYTGRSVYVYDDEGNWGTLALDDLAVVDPDTVFDEDSTIVVDPDADITVTGDWADAPAHIAANRFNTLDDASARFNARKNNAAVPKGMRICIKAGAEFTERCRIFRAQDAKGQCLVDTYGGSAQFSYSERNLDVAVVEVGGVRDFLFEVRARGWAWRIKNGTFDLGYDVANGRPTNASGWTNDTPLSRGFLDFQFPSLFYNSGTGDPNAMVTLDNVDVTGVGWFVINCLVETDIKYRATALFVNDCEFYDNADYTVLNVPALFSLGTKVYTSANRDLGGMGRSRAFGCSRGWTGHPIFLREQLSWTVYVRACYLENRGGWSGIGETGFRGGQQTMRLNNRSESSYATQSAGWVHGRGRRIYFCDSVIMGTFNADSPGDVVTQAPDLDPIGGGHVVVENCLLVYNPQGGERHNITFCCGRTSVRNNVFLTLGTGPQDYSNIPGRDATRFETNDNKAGRFSGPIGMADNSFKGGDRFENRHNTFAMLRVDADLEGSTWAPRSTMTNETFTDANYEIVEGHNVSYAPNLDVPEGPAMDTISLPVGMRVLDVWVKWCWERAEVVLASDVLNGADTSAIPYPVDWNGNATTGADYTGSAGCNAFTRDAEGVNETHYYEPPDDYPNSKDVQADRANADQITVIHDCDASGVVQGDGTGTHFKITNRSGETWVADTWTAVLDRGSTAMTAETLETVNQAELALYRPTTAQALDSGLGSTLFDFNRNLRPNAGFAISPTDGTNASGALLPL